METASREIAPFLVELRDIRNTLRRSLSSQQLLEAKLIGPRPSNPEQLQKSGDTMRSLVCEISVLSSQIEKNVEMHHQMIGSDEGGRADCPAPAMAYR